MSRRTKHPETYILLFPQPPMSGVSHKPSAPLTRYGVQREAQEFLRTKRVPNFWRALDVLRTIGIRVYRQETERLDFSKVRLPKHLEDRRIESEDE